MIYSLFAVKNVDTDQVDFSMTVLSSFRSGHLDNLARTTLEHDETVLAEGRALHGEGGGGTGVPSLEMCVFNVTHVCAS